MGSTPKVPGDPAAPSERRKGPRFAFVASTELTEFSSASKFSGTVTEISRNGCYVDILNTLPAGTPLHVRISCDQGIFETSGQVLYVQDRIGMGVAFIDPPPAQVEILESWLAKL